MKLKAVANFTTYLKFIKLLRAIKDIIKKNLKRAFATVQF